jgi:hypothetical protein
MPDNNNHAWLGGKAGGREGRSPLVGRPVGQTHMTVSRTDRQGRHTSLPAHQLSDERQGTARGTDLCRYDTPALLTSACSRHSANRFDMRAPFHIMTTSTRQFSFCSFSSLLISANTAVYSSDLFIYYAVLLFIWMGFLEAARDKTDMDMDMDMDLATASDYVRGIRLDDKASGFGF